MGDLVFRNIYLKSHWPSCFKEIKDYRNAVPFSRSDLPLEQGKAGRREGFGLEVPVIYRLQGHRKANKWIEAIMKAHIKKEQLII